MEWGPGTPGSGFIVQMGSTTGDMPGTPSPAVGVEDRDIYMNVHNEETTSLGKGHGAGLTEDRCLS